MKRQVVSTCLVGSMLVGTMAAPAMAVSMDKLTDVKTTDWFYPAVQYVAEHDYMIGVGGERFAPTMEMTRSMFVTVLARLEGVDDESAKSNFKDVPDNTWYTKAVNWAAANGIVEGNGADMFLPDQVITRQDMCTMMARYIAYHEKKHNVTHEKKGEEKTFPDADKISSYAQEAVKKCVTWGLIEGNELGYFMPQGTATRAEAAAIISRLSWKSNPSGGGGGGGGSSETAVNYLMKVSLTGDSNLVGGRAAIFQTPIYSVTSTSDKVLSEVANALVSGENLSALESYIGIAKKELLDEDKTFTKEIKGQTVKITITTEGVISVYTSMNMAGLVKASGDVGTLAAVSQADLEALVNKLQSAKAGTSITLTQTDRDALDELISKADDVVTNWSDEKIKEKIDEYVADKPELKQVVAGMKPDAIKAAVGEYKVELEKIQEQVKDTPAGEAQITVEKPVIMMVQADLGEYYTKAVEKYNDPNTLKDAIAKVEEKLGGEFTEAEKAEIKNIYDLNSPDKFIFNMGDKTLKLRSSSEYANLVAANVGATAQFWTVLAEDAEFYQHYLDKLEGIDTTTYGVTYTIGDEDALVAMLAGGGVFYGVEEDMDILTVEGTLSDTTYNSIADKLYDMLTNAGKGNVADLIPMGATPEILNALLGEYTLTVTIDKQ